LGTAIGARAGATAARGSVLELGEEIGYAARRDQARQAWRGIAVAGDPRTRSCRRLGLTHIIEGHRIAENERRDRMLGVDIEDRDAAADADRARGGGDRDRLVLAGCVPGPAKNA